MKRHRHRLRRHLELARRHPADLAEASVCRWRGDPAYRPAAQARVAAALDAG
jgi:hypothetical protein